jgi:hypothetical protein
MIVFCCIFWGNYWLELSPEKTLITHARTEKARFLGYDVSTFDNPGRPGHGHITLRIPPQVIEEKVARYTRGGKPTHRPELVNDGDFTIVGTYGQEYRGYTQYYAYANNRYWLHRLHWVMRYSLLKTLAAKHKSSVSKMTERYTAKTINANGVAKCLQVVIQRIMADECELCGSRDRVQVHHVRKLADLKIEGRTDASSWKQVMASRRRKTLIVCKGCHDAIHAGRPTRMRDPQDAHTTEN